MFIIQHKRQRVLGVPSDAATLKRGRMVRDRRIVGLACCPFS